MKKTPCKGHREYYISKNLGLRKHLDALDKKSSGVKVNLTV